MYIVHVTNCTTLNGLFINCDERALFIYPLCCASTYTVVYNWKVIIQARINSIYCCCYEDY